MVTFIQCGTYLFVSHYSFCTNLSKFANLNLETMKKKIILITTLFITILCHSQNSITLEDIWIDYKFYPKSVSGFKSMQNGDYYTTISKKDNKVKINQHSFETGEIVKILMNTNIFKIRRNF